MPGQQGGSHGKSQFMQLFRKGPDFSRSCGEAVHKQNTNQSALPEEGIAL